MKEMDEILAIKLGRPFKGSVTVPSKQVWFRLPMDIYQLIPGERKPLTIRKWVLDKLLELQSKGTI